MKKFRSKIVETQFKAVVDHNAFLALESRAFLKKLARFRAVFLCSLTLKLSTVKAKRMLLQQIKMFNVELRVKAT